MLDDAVFDRAVGEIESLGHRVSESADEEAIPYAVVAARTNRRWWLVPISNRRIAANGLAMFQPITASARIIKSAGVAANAMGLAGVLPQKKIYISGKSCLTEVFGSEDLYFAFFTGTEGPHRKLAVQVMDKSGAIKGFAKVALKDQVKRLLVHEARTLEYLHTLELQTAQIPNVLFKGETRSAEILVTDTSKTAKSKTNTTLNKTHLAFLAELARKTAAQGKTADVDLSAELHSRYQALAGHLPPAWHDRFRKCIDEIARCEKILGPKILSHGDFTPWNTFFNGSELYVFDWEYADHIYPFGYDLAHFAFTCQEMNRLGPEDKLMNARRTLNDALPMPEVGRARTLLIAYLCGHSLFYAGRETSSNRQEHAWEGAEDAAALIEAALACKD